MYGNLCAQNATTRRKKERNLAILGKALRKKNSSHSFCPLSEMQHSNARASQTNYMYTVGINFKSRTIVIAIYSQ